MTTTQIRIAEVVRQTARQYAEHLREHRCHLLDVDGREPVCLERERLLRACEYAEWRAGQ